MQRYEIIATEKDAYVLYKNASNNGGDEKVLTNQEEVFEYDKLSHLTGIDYYLNNVHQSTQDFLTGYDNCGNITSKTGVSSSILYGEDAGPHTLTTIETPSSSYKHRHRGYRIPVSIKWKQSRTP